MMDVYGSLGAASYGTIGSGIQPLDPTTADDVLTFLGKRVLVPDSAPFVPVPATGKNAWNYLAVTMERLAELSLQTSEATKNAAAFITSLPVGNYALANDSDILALKTKGAVGDFHITITGGESVPYIAGPGSSLVLLSPLAPTDASLGNEPAKPTKKFSIVTPILGAGIGLLVGGPVGAAVGAAVGLGVEAVRTAA
jgi:hypothetical protein